MLATTNHGEVIDEAYIALREARAVALAWMHELVDKLQASHEEDQVAQYQIRVCEMAATCRATYDVDPQYISQICSTPDDIATFIECAIMVHNNTPANFDTASNELRRLIARDRRLAHRMEPHLARSVTKDRTGLDRAIQSLWSSYRPGTAPWKPLELHNARWWRTQTDEEADQKAQRIHVNLLDGRLLIAGKPLGRLPREMVAHPTYLRIFGQVFAQSTSSR